jgi:hypothetical protein
LSIQPEWEYSSRLSPHFCPWQFSPCQTWFVHTKKLNNIEVVVDSDGEEEPISAPSHGLSGNESEQKKPAAKSGANATLVTHPKKKKSRKKKITSFAKVSTDDNNADSDAEFVYSTDAQKAT